MYASPLEAFADTLVPSRSSVESLLKLLHVGLEAEALGDEITDVPGRTMQRRVHVAFGERTRKNNRRLRPTIPRQPTPTMRFLLSCCAFHPPRRSAASHAAAPPASLQSLDTANLPKEISAHRPVWGKVISVYDGDTITIAADLGSGYQAIRCRMRGYDSPEMKPPLNLPNREDTKRRAAEARSYLMTLLGGVGSIHDFQTTGRDKYGRLLADCMIHQSWVSDLMVSQGHGVPYDGGKKTVI